MSDRKHQKAVERKRRLGNRRRRIEYRLRDRVWAPQGRPMLTAGNIQYELADRVRGLGPGGIGAMHLLARRTGLIEAIDRRLHLLKIHLPYYESDHVLNIAYNILCGGTCLEDIERFGMTKFIWTHLAPGGYPIRRRKATSAVDSRNPTSRH